MAMLESFSGGLAGMGACVLSHPADVVRVRLQLHGELSTARVPAPSLKAVVCDVVGRDGLKALQRGLGAGLAYNAVLNCMRFGTYAALREKRVPASAAAAAAGGLSGLVASPLAAVKTRMVQGSSAGCSWRQLAARGGPGLCGTLKGVFGGAGLSSLRVGGSTCAQFAVYEASKKRLQTELREPLAQLVAGLLSAVGTALVVHPLDVVTTRLYNQQGRYAGPLDCAWQTVKAEGPKGFGKGLAATALRQLPHSACTLLFLEQLRAVLKPRFA